jgi:hypothetical protein
MKGFIFRIVVLSIVTLLLIKLIYVIFKLGEMEWYVIASTPIVMLYLGVYGFPFVKSKDQE